MTLHSDRGSWALKIAGIGLTCTAILLIGVAAHIQTIDPNEFKLKIETSVAEHINGSLSLGTISWSFWPSIGLTTADGRLQDLNNNDIVTWKKSRIDIKIWHLLFGDINVGTLTIETPHITATIANGRNTWKELIQPQTDNTSESTTQDMLPYIGIDSIKLNKAQLLITTDHTTTTMSALNIHLNDFYPNELATLSITGLVDVQIQEENEEAFSIKSNVEVVTKFSFKPDEEIEIESFTLKRNLKDITHKSIDFTIDSMGSYNFEQDALQLNPFRISVDTGLLESTLSVEKLKSSPEVIVMFPVQKPLFGSLATTFLGRPPPNSHIADLIQSLKVGGSLIFTQDQVGLLLEPFDIDAHKGKIDTQYEFDTGHLNSIISLQYIDLRPIIEPSEAAQFSGTKQVKNKEKPEGVSTPLPIDLLSKLSMHAEIRISNLITPQVEIQELNMKARTKNGTLNIAPISFLSFDGVIVAQAKLDVTKNPATLALYQSSDRLNIGEALTRTTENNWLTGSFDNKLNVTSHGNSFEDILTNINGTLEIKIAQGEIPGANLEDIAFQSIGQLKGILSPSARASFKQAKSALQPGSKIQDFFANLTITPERVTTKKALLQLNGKPANTNIAYSIEKKNLVFTTNIKLDSSDSKLADLSWPVTCQLENWNLPKCGVIKEKIRRRVEDLTHSTAKTQAQKKLVERLKEINKLNEEDETNNSGQ